MAKKSTTPRPARTPREVLQPEIAAIGAMTPEQLAARAADLDQARLALKAAGDAAAAAQEALDALPNDATDERRNDVLNALEDAEKAVKAAEAKLKELTGSEGETAKPVSANAPATSSTHTPESEGQGGAGNGAGPAGGDHAPLDAGVLVVTTKRPSRWRAGRQFTKGAETRIPMVDLTEVQCRAISEDPALESRVEPS